MDMGLGSKTMNDIKKESGSGIRYISAEGKVDTLEGHLDEEEKQEKGADLRESIGVPIYKYKYPIREKDKGDKPHKRESTTKIYSRQEINDMQWEQVMQSSASRHDLTGVIIGALLSGRNFTVEDMVKEVNRIYPSAVESKIKARFFSLYSKSPLRHLLDTKKVGDGTLAKTHRLKAVGRELTPEELDVIYYGRSKAEDLTILYEVHPELKSIIEEGEKETGNEESTHTANVRVQPEEFPMQEISDGIRNAVKTSIESLGVNVNVSGRVEIVFKFEIS
jgi:hypothetical protein